MIWNYFKIALRSMLKDKAYVVINIIGLALGLSCCILILLFIEDELGYDRFHDDSDRIYRLRVDRIANGGETEYTSTSAAPMLPAALKDILQIEAGTQISLRTYLVAREDVSFYEERYFFADAAFFEVFTFNLLRGDADQVLVAPNSLVLTESTAARYFDDDNPIGQTLEVEGQDMTITGVVEDVPSQSHFDFDMLASMSTLEATQGPRSTWGWWNLGFHTYLKLIPGADISEVEALLHELPSRYIPDQESSSGYRQFLLLQPLEEIHLGSHYRYELGNNSQREYVFAFAAVAIFVLLIACVNFMNLATARSAERAREVGMRKVLGAGKGQLISQFLGESVAITLIALVIAIVLIQFMLPLFNGMALKSLSINYIERWSLLLILILGAVVVGIFSGLYPAFALSSHKPADALKSQPSPGSASSWLRQSLVIFQFSISVFLIIASVVSQRQLNFMMSSDMGFEKEQTLVINSRNSDFIVDQFETFKQSLSAISGVGGVTVSSSIPGRTIGTNVSSRQQGMVEDGQTFYHLAVGYDFIDTYGLEVLSGRGFSREFGSDIDSAFVINEAAYQALGWEDSAQPLGQQLTRQFSDTRAVIGVVRDFNFQSLQFEVEPLVLFINPPWFAYTSVNVPTENIEITIASLEQVWNRFAPDRPFEYFFLSDDFDRQYRSEMRISSLLKVFTLIAVGIASMGLFALSSFVTERRSKEIGIRKVVGASTAQIVIMLTYSFSKPVLAAVILALPVSWLLANRWLEMFANRIPISWDIFGIATVLALTIAFATVAWQSVKAALANPVISIRSE